MSESPVLVDQQAGVVTITLNRPERLNALTPELLEDLFVALTEVDPQATAVVIRGSGRAFCGGYDLKVASSRTEAGPPSQAIVRLGAERLQRITKAMRACRPPIIAAVHGYAVGGGSEIALSCDLVLATRTSTFGFPETGVGLSVTNGVTGWLPKVVGLVKAKELVFLGEFISGEEAAALGLVNRVVDDGMLDAELDAVITRIRSRSALAVSLSKQLIDAGIDRTLSQTLDAEVDAAVIAETSDEADAAMRGFAASSRE